MKTREQFNTWISIDQFTVANDVLPSYDFVDSTGLDSLHPYAYIADQPTKHFKSLKDNIVVDNVLFNMILLRTTALQDMMRPSLSTGTTTRPGK